MKVMCTTECCICHKDLGRSFEVDTEQNEMARRHYEKYGKVVSHGYCQECFDTHVQSQIDESKAKAALTKVAV